MLRKLKKEVRCRARAKKMEEEHVVERKIGDNVVNIENIQRKALKRKRPSLMNPQTSIQKKTFCILPKKRCCVYCQKKTVA